MLRSLSAPDISFSKRLAARAIPCRRFFRILFSSGPQRWQNLHATPFLQQFLWMKSHGLQKPALCPTEPADGHAGVPIFDATRYCDNSRTCDLCSFIGMAVAASVLCREAWRLQASWSKTRPGTYGAAMAVSGGGSVEEPVLIGGDSGCSRRISGTSAEELVELQTFASSE